MGGDMATISVGGAAGEGFSVIRRHPGAVAIWALLVVGLLAFRIAVSVPIYVTLFARMAHGAVGGGASPDITALLPQLQQAQALGFLLSLASLFVNTVVICAVYRAVLRPEQNQFGYLRVGSAELFLCVFTIGAIIAFVIAAIVVAIPLALIGAIVAHGSPGGGAVFGAMAAIAVLVGATYLILRISLIGPMMVDDGQFHLGEAWALTRGKVGSLFLIALLLVIMILTAEIVLVGIGAGLVGAMALGIGQVQTLAQQSPAALLSRFAPVLLVEGVGWIVLIAVVMPVFAAPWARAYRDLRQTDVAAAFS